MAPEALGHLPALRPLAPDPPASPPMHANPTPAKLNNLGASKSPPFLYLNGFACPVALFPLVHHLPQLDQLPLIS